MRDPLPSEVEQPPEHLVSQNLQFQPADLTPTAVFLRVLVEIRGEVVHDDVEVLLIGLICEERIADAQHAGVVQRPQYLQLSVLVLLVLVDPLYRHQLQRLFVTGLVHHSESARTHLVLVRIPRGSHQTT